MSDEQAEKLAEALEEFAGAIAANAASHQAGEYEWDADLRGPRAALIALLRSIHAG